MIQASDITVTATGQVLAHGRQIAQINADQHGRRRLYRIASFAPFIVATPALCEVTRVFHTDRLAAVVAEALA